MKRGGAVKKAKDGGGAYPGFPHSPSADGGMEENFQVPKTRARRRPSFANRPNFLVGTFAWENRGFRDPCPVRR
jgi:hypothetical protein